MPTRILSTVIAGLNAITTNTSSCLRSLVAREGINTQIHMSAYCQWIVSPTPQLSSSGKIPWDVPQHQWTVVERANV